MTTFTRRLSVLALAAALVASVAVDPTLAQPGGGINNPSPGSNTALSNEGAPIGGTGNIGTTRVGPSRQTARTSQRQRARQRQRAARRAPARAVAPTPASDTGLAPR